MRRRDFLKWLGMAPVAGLVAASATRHGLDAASESVTRTVHSTWMDPVARDQDLGPDEGLNLYEPEPGVEYKWERVEPRPEGTPVQFDGAINTKFDYLKTDFEGWRLWYGYDPQP